MEKLHLQPPVKGAKRGQKPLEEHPQTSEDSSHYDLFTRSIQGLRQNQLINPRKAPCVPGWELNEQEWDTQLVKVLQKPVLAPGLSLSSVSLASAYDAEKETQSYLHTLGSL